MPKPHDAKRVDDFLQVLQNLKQKCVDLKENATKHLASLFVGETNRLKSGRECHRKFDESIITKAQQTIGEIESFEDKLTAIKQKLSDIFKNNRYFVNEKKRMRKRQYDNKWKSEKRRKVSKLHDNVCEFENVCKDLSNRLGGKLLSGEYDPEMGVFQITEMTYKALVENIQTDTEEHVLENLFEKECFRGAAYNIVEYFITCMK